MGLPGCLVFDLRTPEEYREMHLPGAKNCPAAGLAAELGRLDVPKDTPIVLYCRLGLRSRAAAAELALLGYTRAGALGGIIDWPYEVEDSSSP